MNPKQLAKLQFKELQDRLKEKNQQEGISCPKCGRRLRVRRQNGDYKILHCLHCVSQFVVADNKISYEIVPGTRHSPNPVWCDRCGAKMWRRGLPRVNALSYHCRKCNFTKKVPKDHGRNPLP